MVNTVFIVLYSILIGIYCVMSFLYFKDGEKRAGVCFAGVALAWVMCLLLKVLPS